MAKTHYQDISVLENAKDLGKEEVLKEVYIRFYELIKHEIDIVLTDANMQPIITIHGKPGLDWFKKRYL